MIVREFRQTIPAITMYRMTNILLAIVVLAHSLAGCCWHHAHAAEPSAKTTCCSHLHADETADHGDSDHHSKDGSVPGESSPDGCQEGSCVFLRDGGAPSVGTMPMLALDSYAPIASDPGLGSVRLALAACHASQPLAPPTRLHLLHQLLLV
jgi:hypothetical protein